MKKMDRLTHAMHPYRSPHFPLSSSYLVNFDKQSPPKRMWMLMLVNTLNIVMHIPFLGLIVTSSKGSLG